MKKRYTAHLHLASFTTSYPAPKGSKTEQGAAAKTINQPTAT